MRIHILYVLTALVVGIMIGYGFVGLDLSGRKNTEYQPLDFESSDGQKTTPLPERTHRQENSKSSGRVRTSQIFKEPTQGPLSADPKSRHSQENLGLHSMTGFENHDFGKEIRNTAQAWFEKGIALNDDSAQEVSFYHKALKLDSGFAPAHYRLGAIYMRQARFEKAEKHFALFWSLATRAEKEDYNIHLYTDEQTLEDRLDKQAGNYTDEHQSGVSIPYHPVGNQIVVRVVLDGNIRSDMLLDTGASITVIAEQLARLGRFPVKGNIRLHNISRNAVSAFDKKKERKELSSL